MTKLNEDRLTPLITEDYTGLQVKEQAVKYAEMIVAEYVFVVQNALSSMYRYDTETGLWRDDTNELIESYMDRVIPHQYSSHLVEEVKRKIRGRKYSPEIVLDGDAEHIVCKNGVLDLKTGQLSEFAPDGHHMSAVPVVFDPDAKCPMFLKFLDQVLSNQTDKDAIIEMFGYCLQKNYTYEIAVLLVGEGANGKSVLLEVLRRFLGPENVTSVTPQNLTKSRFASSYLCHKLANIQPDIPARPIEDAGTLKTLTGSDLTHAEVKYGGHSDFLNHAKLIFAGNAVPPSWDMSKAYCRRWRIIDFLNTFSPQDPNYVPRDILLARLTSSEELSGILNLALKGLLRLSQQHQLSGTPSMKDQQLDYMKRSDPARYFLEAYIYQDTEGPPIPKAVLYDLYIKMCRFMGKVPIKRETFGGKVKMFVSYAEDKRPRERDETSDRERVYAWYGIGFNQERYDKETGALI